MHFSYYFNFHFLTLLFFSITLLVLIATWISHESRCLIKISMAMDEEGIDISHHQGKIDWSQLKLSGKKFVIMKATEGVTFQDPEFVDNFSNASLAGFQVGAYHFMRFNTSSPPDQQMKNFLSELEKGMSASPVEFDKQQLIVALDVEESSKEDDYSLVSNVVETSVRYLKEKNIIPYIYTTQYFWDKHIKTTPDIVKLCSLWIARWRDIPPASNELPNGWQNWKIWQYSAKGSVLGITGDVDLDKMKI